MVENPPVQHWSSVASDILFAEARAIDERRWDDWLAMFHVDAELWVPARKSDEDFTSDPHREVSLIYASSRALLRDRVTRARSGASSAANSTSRTAHFISNVYGAPSAENSNAMAVHAMAMTYSFSTVLNAVNEIVSRLEYELVSEDGHWLIKKKTARILNNVMPPVVDFYTV